MKNNYINEVELELNEWLNIVLDPEEKVKYSISGSCFPTNEHLDEYIATIDNRDEGEIIKLLEHFLISSGSLGIDESRKKWLLTLTKNEIEKIKLQSTYVKRLLSSPNSSPPWEGITWILDLLPDFPQEAISTLDSYFNAHLQFLPDGRISGISDASTIIRKKYLEHDLPIKDTLLNLTPRDFELLIGYLYKQKGYTVTITQHTNDGGYDVLAVKKHDRENERLHIECKRFSKNVGVKIIRSTLGTLSVNNATKAIIIASTLFTRQAKFEAYKSKRVELINLNELDKDLRKYTNTNWTSFVSKFVMEMKVTCNK